MGCATANPTGRLPRAQGCESTSALPTRPTHFVSKNNRGSPAPSELLQEIPRAVGKGHSPPEPPGSPFSCQSLAVYREWHGASPRGHGVEGAPSRAFKSLTNCLQF